MAKLTAARRRKLPASAYVYRPGTRLGGRHGSYPIDTPARARNALARAAQAGTKGAYSTVAKAVRRKHGNTVASVGRKRGTVSRPGYRRRRKKR